jgi:superfamily II DNA/RNA helicase
VKCFVLDEADRMLDMGFINDVKKIIMHLPKTRHKTQGDSSLVLPPCASEAAVPAPLIYK